MSDAEIGPIDPAERGRLAWRCRRGMKELDVLLRAWLENRYALAGAERRAAFSALLEMPDPDLARCLLSGDRPASGAVNALLDELADYQEKNNKII